MASTLKPGGFMVGSGGLSGVVNGQLKTYPMANSYATNIGVGDLVKLGTDGTVQKVTVSTDYPVGVFAGLKPEGQGYIPSKAWVQFTSASAGKTIYALVAGTDPFSVFEVQADGSVSVGDVGTNFDVTVSTMNTVYGISTARVHASSRSDAAGVVKMVGISQRADNAITDAYPFILVKVNNHQFGTKVSVA